MNTKSNNQDAFKIQIYPNPANESMKVQFYENNLPKEIRLQLFNSLGQLVYSKKQLSTQKLELQKNLNLVQDYLYCELKETIK
ncbi:MAG: T9SS type A sorting domain-containing protein [Saprospiraceae bacterium]|nr:T9SS type A sorting domain-containing protein [Saprospiraceae bacterium]